jgi:hypothetical protein
MPYCVGLQAATAAFLSASFVTQFVLVIFAISTVFFVASAKPTKERLVDEAILLPMFPILPGV